METTISRRLTPVAEALAPCVLQKLRDEIRALRSAAEEYERVHSRALEDVLPAHRPSARNLLHYLALRHEDARDVQAHLARVGLSSLGRAESHVLVTLDRMDGLLTLALGETLSPQPEAAPHLGFREGERRLEHNSMSLLGTGRDGRPVRIMVTLPSEAATDLQLVEDMAAAGMDCARINCAHDDEAAWQSMVENVHVAGRRQGRDLKVLMDLPGPKLRTGRIGGSKKPRVKPGDRVLLVERLDEGPEPPEDTGVAVAEGPVRELRKNVNEGDVVWIDDGRIQTRVLGLDATGILLGVIHTTKEKGVKLTPEKGVNLPGRRVEASALTDEDRGYLRFASELADAVSLSFVRTPSDVDELIDAMAGLRNTDLGVVLKIETVEGFSNLPHLLLRAMRRPATGIMIARGDLAVEVGFERLAEVQEEVLWICEAAHVPTVWATQVLEQLAKTGTPSRAEITDAAMSVRAEAVMLNKGKHILSAIGTLDEILLRMEAHQLKKRSLMRPLRVSLLEDSLARHDDTNAMP